ncbi:hypothetical protein ILUMI_12731 [Ignelater luminosus]|uniref:Sorbitol dehydrogenase n=1 Tax=Ignelater luminosus TaxID=2038154 RepID=A0A8K0GC21_IGNLU|nr:hypothetical protein ILUMI_12731 [Ignelater luminosus]
MPLTKNVAAVLHGKNDLRLEERPIPKPKSNEALLQMECIGICGSDVHFWVHGSIGTYIVEKPMIIGHEASGIVIEVGSEVKHLKKGDRVAIEPGVPCRICNFCKEGNYNVCNDMIFCACPPCDGNLVRYYCQAADFLYKLPDHVSLEEGALLEPFSVAVHACKKGGVTADSVVLIMGAGPVGLCTVIATRAYGATKIIVVDLVEFRLQQALSFGADYILKINPTDSEREIIKRILEVLGEEPNISIDCTGLESCVRICMLAAKKKGVMVEVGMGKPEMNLPLFEAQCKEVDIRSCFRYCNDYPTALALVSSGKANIKPLITHHYRLEDSVQAFQVSKTGVGNAIKVMIHANPNWKP